MDTPKPLYNSNEWVILCDGSVAQINTVKLDDHTFIYHLNVYHIQYTNQGMMIQFRSCTEHDIIGVLKIPIYRREHNWMGFIHEERM